MKVKLFCEWQETEMNKFLEENKDKIEIFQILQSGNRSQGVLISIFYNEILPVSK